MSELLKDGRTAHVNVANIINANKNQRRKILPVKMWLLIKPQYERLPGEEYKIKRISDGEVFEMFADYEYEIINGQQYYYDIVTFNDDLRRVSIRIYNEHKQFQKGIQIQIKNLKKPVKA